MAQHSEKTIANTKRAASIEAGAISYGLAVGVDAVDSGHIAFAEATKYLPERLVAGPKAPSHKQWKKLRYIVAPVAKAVLQYAKASSKLTKKEVQLGRLESELVDEAAELVAMAGQLMQHRSWVPSTVRSETDWIRRQAMRTRDRQR